MTFRQYKRNVWKISILLRDNRMHSGPPVRLSREDRLARVHLTFNNDAPRVVAFRAASILFARCLRLLRLLRFVAFVALCCICCALLRLCVSIIGDYFVLLVPCFRAGTVANMLSFENICWADIGLS
jgi:hypothetical protein